MTRTLSPSLRRTSLPSRFLKPYGSVRTGIPGMAVLGFYLFVLSGLAAAAPTTLADLLERPTAPAGVVFEIVDRDPAALTSALPWVKQAAERLRRRYPALPMAVVSHGGEMFALQTTQRNRNQGVHQLAESLGQQGIPVHVCETHAGWRGLAPEDFPAYIDVAPEGPAQVRNYEALDYVRLVVPRSR